MMIDDKGAEEVSVSSQEDYIRELEGKLAAAEKALQNNSHLGTPDQEWIEHLEQENADLCNQVGQFAEILDSIKDGFLVFDSEWRFVYVNQRAAQSSEFKPAELIGRSIWEVFPQFVGTELETNYREVMQSRQNARFEIEDPRNGKWYDVSVYPAGSGICVFWDDIERRKRVRAQRDRLLLENKQQFELLMVERLRLETVLAQSPAGIMVVDALGGIRFCNEAAKQMLESPIPYGGNYLNQIGLQLYYPDGGGLVDPRDRPLIKAALDGETFVDYEYDILKTDGRRINIAGNTAPIHDAQGNLSGAVAVFSDITARKQAARNDAFLHSLSEWLMVMRSPEEVTEGVVEQVGKHMGVDRCILAEIDQEGNEHKALGDYHENLPGMHLNIPLTELPEALRTPFENGQPVMVKDLLEDPQLKPVAEMFSNLYQIRSFLAIPWLDSSGTWRALLTIACQQPNQWSQEMIEFLTSVNNIAWLAIRNARLYKDLQTSGERFHFTLKDSPIFTATTDCNLRFTWGYNTFFGTTPEMIIGKRLDELLPSEQIAPVMASMQMVIDSGKGQRSERSYTDESGANYTFDLIFEPLREDKGEVAGISIVAINVSDRKKLERELIRRETQYRRMLNTTFDGVWIMEPEGKTTFINDQGANMLGYTPHEMTGKDSKEYLFPEDLPKEIKILKRRRQGINEFSEQRLRHKDGHEIWIRSSTASIFGEDQDYQGVLMMFTDITHDKMAEAALRESNDRFQIALNVAPITIFNTDARLRYTWIYNSRVAYNQGGIVGKRDDELLPPESAAELIALKQSVLDSGVGVRKEIRLKLPDGWKVYDLTIEPLRDNKGETVGLAGAAFDATNTRRIEEESLKNRSRVEVQRRLIQQREMERLQIASDLHDTVLQELIGVHFNFSEALDIPDKDMRLQKMEALQHEIRNQIHTLRNYCNDLRPPSLAPFGLERTIRSHISAFREHYPGYRCSLNLYKDGQTIPEEIRMVLYRVYQEALSNIIKHAGAGRVWVRLSMRKNAVELEVRDDGKGFHLPERWPERMAHSGHFGLLGMQERVEAVGGNLKIITRVGKGTKIIGIIPIDEHLSQDTEQ